VRTFRAFYGLCLVERVAHVEGMSKVPKEPGVCIELLPSQSRQFTRSKTTRIRSVDCKSAERSLEKIFDLIQTQANLQATIFTNQQDPSQKISQQSQISSEMMLNIYMYTYTDLSL
jgi:hypothetical protein